MGPTSLSFIANSKLGLLVIGIILLAGVVYLVKAWSKPEIPSLPFPEARVEPRNATAALLGSMKKWPDEPFVLRMGPTPWVILPHSLMPEIKGQPEEKVSFKKMSYDRFLGQYTGLGQSKSPAAINAIKVDLTRNVAKVLNDLQDEAQYAFDREIGKLPQWTEIGVYQKMIQIVAGCSGRAFVGLPLCRDKEWRDATISFTYDTLASVHAMKAYNKALWPLVSQFLPELRKLRSYREFAHQKLRPQIDTIIAHHLAKKDNPEVSTEEDLEFEAIKHNYNLLHWTIGQHSEPHNADPAEVGHMQMTAAFAALSPIGMSMSYAIFDLAAYPDVAKELREEIAAVIAEDKPPNGWLLKSSLPKLRKLDSFMKESQRLNPPFLTTVTRVVTAPQGLVLSTGQTIPHGVTIAFGNPFLSDANIKFPPLTNHDQPPLSEFSPFRYSELRKIPGEENGHQFVSADANNPSFGYGRHACPGRFFASNEIKVLLVELLQRYDLALGPKGECLKDGFEKPKRLEMGFTYIADPQAKVYFRSRQSS